MPLGCFFLSLHASTLRRLYASPQAPPSPPAVTLCAKAWAVGVLEEGQDWPEDVRSRHQKLSSRVATRTCLARMDCVRTTSSSCSILRRAFPPSSLGRRRQ